MKSLDLGVSGCKLEMITPGIIRKSATNPEYGQRLIRQAVKQIDFTKSNKTSFISPEVIELNLEFPQHFDMEYIPGSSFSDFFKSAQTIDVDRVVEILFEFLDSEISQSSFFEANNVFEFKLEQLKPGSRYKEFIEKLAKVCAQEKFLIPRSACHGDLTLANMLFKGGHVYLIDFLDSYLDSFLIDLAKLKQDLYHHWTPLLGGETQLRIYSVFNYMWEKIESRYANYLSNPSFGMIESINLLRIEPYLHNESQRNILDQMLRKVGEN